MYKNFKFSKSKLTGVQTYPADTIEERVKKILSANEPITDGAPIIYTERKDGVQAGYNIRTDRFEIAVDAMDAVAKSHKARREERAKVVEMKRETGGQSTAVDGATE